MYTGLRIRGVLHPHAIEAVKYLYGYGRDRTNASRWGDVRRRYPGLVSEHFVALPRAQFIPFGGVTFANWEIDPQWPRGKQDDLQNNYWVFQCCLKNGDEIRTFLEDLVPQFFLQLDHAESRYEEDDVSALYALEEGKVLVKRRAWGEDPRTPIQAWDPPATVPPDLQAELEYRTSWMKLMGARNG